MVSWKLLAAAALLFSLGCDADGAILFPEEVSSLAGVAYSILPPIKLGQDSRLGFGFRLGRNADAQFLVELGPQTNTAALGQSSGKRQSNESSDKRQQRQKNIKKKKEISTTIIGDKNIRLP